MIELNDASSQIDQLFIRYYFPILLCLVYDQLPLSSSSFSSLSSTLDCNATATIVQTRILQLDLPTESMRTSDSLFKWGEGALIRII